jgi:hypothetical protein
MLGSFHHAHTPLQQCRCSEAQRWRRRSPEVAQKKHRGGAEEAQRKLAKCKYVRRKDITRHKKSGGENAKAN